MFKLTVKNRILRVMFYSLLSVYTFTNMFSNRNSQAFGQTFNDQDLTTARNIIEKAARDIIGRHIPEKDYVLIIDVQADPTNESAPSTSDIPYLPENLTKVELLQNNTKSLVANLKSVQFKILLVTGYTQEAQNQIAEILSEKFGLDQGRGDQITFGVLNIENKNSPDAENLKREIEKLNGLLDQSKKDLEDLRNEKNQSKSNDPAESENDPSKPISEEAKKSEDEVANQSAWHQHISLFAIAIATLLGLILLGILLKSGFANFGGFFDAGLGKVAKSLESLAKSNDFEPESDKKQDMNPVSHADGGAKTTDWSDLEVLHRRIITLHEDLVETLASGGTETESLVLLHVGRMLGDEEEVERAVSIMELFGRDKANELYHKLGSEQKAAVLEFLARGRYSRPKAQILLEVAEEMKTKLLAGGLTRITGHIEPEVEMLAMKLSDEDLVALILEMNDQELARTFHYFDAPRIARAVQIVRSQDQKAFQLMTTALARLPKVGDAKELDDTLKHKMSARLEKASADLERPYLGFYRLLIEAVSDEAQDELVENLSRENPRLDEFLSESVITFGTFFKLDPEIKEQICERLSLKELAALLLSLEAEQKDWLRSTLEERQLQLVDEEAERLKGQGERTLKQAISKARRTIVNQIKKFKGDAPIKELFASKKGNETPKMSKETDTTRGAA